MFKVSPIVLTQVRSRPLVSCFTDDMLPCSSQVPLQIRDVLVNNVVDCRLIDAGFLVKLLSCMMCPWSYRIVSEYLLGRPSSGAQGRHI